MRTIENHLLPHMNMSLSDYIRSSRMAEERVWGTDIEIFAAASLLSTDIYVYGSTGTNFTWNKSMLDGLPPQNTRSIYIQNTSGVHYDVVLSVCMGASSDRQNLSKKTKSIDHSSKAHFLNKHVKIEQCLKRKDLSDASPFASKLLKSENVDMQVFCNEHGASSSKLLQKAENPKQHEKTDVLGSENYSINLKLFHDSLQYTIVQCSECFEAWPIKCKPKSGANYVCRRCKIDKNIPKKFSAQNNMIPSSLPNELLDSN